MNIYKVLSLLEALTKVTVSLFRKGTTLLLPLGIKKNSFSSNKAKEWEKMKIFQFPFLSPLEKLM